MANRAVVGIVSSQAQAEAVVDSLQRAGFSSTDISALFPDRTETRISSPPAAHTATPGQLVPVIGGHLGRLPGVGALAVPGLGMFIAAGPIMTALSGGDGDRVEIERALLIVGIPESETKQYVAKLKNGDILLSVHVDDADERARARGVMATGGATDVVTVGEESVAQ